MCAIRGAAVSAADDALTTTGPSECTGVGTPSERAKLLARLTRLLEVLLPPLASCFPAPAVCEPVPGDRGDFEPLDPASLCVSEAAELELSETPRGDFWAIGRSFSAPVVRVFALAFILPAAPENRSLGAALIAPAGAADPRGEFAGPTTLIFAAFAAAAIRTCARVRASSGEKERGGTALFAGAPFFDPGAAATRWPVLAGATLALAVGLDFATKSTLPTMGGEVFADRAAGTGAAASLETTGADPDPPVAPDGPNDAAT